MANCNSFGIMAFQSGYLRYAFYLLALSHKAKNFRGCFLIVIRKIVQ